jgi:hypothetical protein
MKPVKWDNVKLKAKKEANLKPDVAVYAVMEAVACKTMDWRRKYQELQEEVWNVIAKWDIRQAKKLYELFPSILPKDCTFTCDMDQNGDWVIF